MQTFDELWRGSTPNSWARVPRGPLAVAVGGWVFGATATAFTVGATAVAWGTIGGFLITTAIASWAMGALMPKQEGAQSQQGILSNRREPVGDFDIVYGRVRKGGVITFMDTNGDDNRNMRFCLVLAGHEVHAIDDIYINDEIVTLDGNGRVTGDRWKSKVRIVKYLGTADQTADPTLVQTTDATTAFRGRGIAYLYVLLEYDQEVFADGIPTITAIVRGKKVWDPRIEGFAWSDNAALCIRDYLSEPYGVNSRQAPESIRSPSWVVGANVCDSLVPTAGGGSEPRYRLNGVVSTANTPRDNLQRMLTSCGGTLFWGSGQWQFKPGYFPSGPYVSLDAGDLRSGISMTTKNSRKENFNAVTGTFVNAAEDYIETEYPKFSSSVFLAQDNGQDNILDMQLPYTTSGRTAQRLAKMAMFRSREEIIISADFSLKTARCNVGDVVQFTFPRYGFTNKFFEVMSWRLVPDGGELKVNLVLKETSADAYSWTAEERDILRNNTRLPRPTSGLTVSNLRVVNRQTVQSDGSLLGEVVLEWDAARSAFIDKYTVQWKRVSDTNWSATDTTETSIILPSVQSNVPYVFRVRATSIGGFVGPWEQIGATVDGKNTPPGIPTAFSATDRYRAVDLKWTNPTDRDLNHIEIYRNTTNTSTGATLVGKSGGTKFIVDMAPMEVAWFFIRAVDHSGNKSPFTTGRQGTGLFIDNVDVDINVRDLMEDAGLAPVEILDTLPTTGNVVGRTVYNTTDRQLYIWNGTAWEKAVDADITDVDLSIGNFPPNLRPIEIVSTLPTTGNFNGRVVMLLSDGKLYRRVGNAWTAAVPAIDVTGQLTNNQIADLAAIKISGTIATGQIANDAITAAKLGPLAVEAASIANNAITATKIADNAITTGKLSAGAVVADKIAANAITASKMVITDYNNIVPDPEYYDIDETWNVNRSAGSFAISSNQPPANYGQARVMTIRNMVPGPTGYRTLFSSDGFPAQPSVEYFASAKIWKTSTMNWYLRVGYYDNTDSFIGNAAFFNNNDTRIGNISEEISFTPPADVAAFKIELFSNGSATSDINIGQIWVKQKAGASLIVDGAITADKIATNAVTAVKVNANAITAGKIAANAVTANTIAANSITSAKIEAGAVTANELAANAVTADKILANSITTAKIAAGAIAADKIQANAIKASKLVISDMSNMVPEGDFNEDGANWTLQGSGTATVFNIANTGLGEYMMRLDTPASPNTSYTGVVSKNIGVTPGRVYYVAANIFSSGAHDTLFRINWRDSQGNSLSNANITAGLNYNWEHRSGTLTAPAGAQFAQVALYIRNDAGSTAYIQMTNVTMRQAASGELIVDGAITATKIAANAVNAEKIVANSITAGLIAAGAIEATAIAANAVTAAKINVNNLSAISANLGTITAGSININDNFIVASDGRTTIRSGTSGERLVITQNGISVFDNNNVLRVRIGQL